MNTAEQSQVERKTRIGLRVSEKEALEIKEQAEASRLTLSEYVRRRIFGKRIVPQADMNVLAELRRLGGLLKHIYNETRGMYSELTANAIRALEAYAKALERALRNKNSEDGGIDSS